ncbi:MAG: hotdog fold thioesterase [Myxococcota bacterium]
MSQDFVPEADAWGRTLGVEFLELTPERVSARLEAGPRHHQPYGVLHGGVYCSIVEAVASYGAGQRALALGQTGVLGVSNATDFFRSHSTGELRCEGRPAKRAIRAGVELPLAEGLALEQQEFERCMRSQDAAGALRAWLAGERWDWKGE